MPPGFLPGAPERGRDTRWVILYDPRNPLYRRSWFQPETDVAGTFQKARRGAQYKFSARWGQ